MYALACYFNNSEDKWVRNHFYERCFKIAQLIKIDGGKKEAEAHAHMGLLFEEDGEWSFIRLSWLALEDSESVQPESTWGLRKRPEALVWECKLLRLKSKGVWLMNWPLRFLAVICPPKCSGWSSQQHYHTEKASTCTHPRIWVSASCCTILNFSFILTVLCSF